jgi:predicted transposase YdaD
VQLPWDIFMAKPADVSTKRLINAAPENWVRWVTQMPNLSVKEMPNTEFQWISRETDVLIRVQNPQKQDFLVINELQLRYKPEMPKRVRAYTALAEEKYNLPVFPVLINILKVSDTEIPTRYESNFEGIYARQDYRVINLWEIDVNVAFGQQIASLLPFVPMLKDGGNESTIREALRLIRASEQLNQFETVLGFFANFVLDTALVKQIMRWDMAILQESPWYQQIEQRGRCSEKLMDIQISLEVKFGSSGLELMPQISEISDLERLTEIFRATLTANTLDEVRRLF